MNSSAPLSTSFNVVKHVKHDTYEHHVNHYVYKHNGKHHVLKYDTYVSKHHIFKHDILEYGFYLNDHFITIKDNIVDIYNLYLIIINIFYADDTHIDDINDVDDIDDFDFDHIDDHFHNTYLLLIYHLIYDHFYLLNNHLNHVDNIYFLDVHYLHHIHFHHVDLDTRFLIQGTSSGVRLSSVDIMTGQQTLIRSNIAGNLDVNALGYNARDDYLYAIAQNGLLSAISIIRINARGDISVAVPQVANKLALLGGFNAGDVDENSQYWVSTSGNDWYQYDFRPGSATYAQQIAYGNLPLLSRPSQVIADWAYVPGGGDFLWAIATAGGGRTVLMQFSRSTKRWTQVRDFGNIVGGTLLGQAVWGAVYASADGFLYGTENLTGQVWRFPVLSSATSATRLATGSPATLNDGARCLEAPNLPS
ncbi:hypothetical protein ACHAQH_007376 [Verticillium albo-atrum]